MPLPLYLFFSINIALVALSLVKFFNRYEQKILSIFYSILLLFFVVLIFYIYNFYFPSILIDEYIFTIIKIVFLLITLLHFSKHTEGEKLFIVGLFFGIIYLDGGIWKLLSPFWQQGDNFLFEYYFNPTNPNFYLFSLISDNVIQQLIAYLIIFYQIGMIFVFLFVSNVWVRKIVFSIGVLQHIGGILFFNLYLFSLFMIIIHLPLFYKVQVIKFQNISKPIMVYMFFFISIMLFQHGVDYENKSERPIFSKDKSYAQLLKDPSYSQHSNRSITELSRIFYQPLNVYIPLKHFSSTQIDSLFQSKKGVFSKKLLSVYNENEELLFTNLEHEKKKNSFDLNVYKNKLIAQLVLRFTNNIAGSKEILNTLFPREKVFHIKEGFRYYEDITSLGKEVPKTHIYKDRYYYREGVVFDSDFLKTIVARSLFSKKMIFTGPIGDLKIRK